MMNNATKNIIYSIVLVGLTFAAWKSRQENESTANPHLITIDGETMGTTYQIKYLDSAAQKNHKKKIGHLLRNLNKSLSTYIEDSEISTFNKNKSHIYKSPFFYPVLRKSREINQTSAGAFDPTVMPLVNAWGFGPEKSNIPDKGKVDSLKSMVGFMYLNFNKDSVWKVNERLKLDFSAIAKGYAVDTIADYLSSKGINHMMVEIGGEVRCKGKSDNGKPWIIGIVNPDESSEKKVYAALKLEDKAMATSGNYRNYYIKDGKKYAHTIDPKTGYPVNHSMLSVSVMANDCMTADAYATAFMVLGLEKSKRILIWNPNLEAYFIYASENGEIKTHITTRFEEKLANTNQ